jgi:hypothetical protein
MNPDEDAHPTQDMLTPEEMKAWLHHHIEDLSKAMELQMHDAIDFVTAYALGKLTPEEADRRLDRYQTRWGDSPIPGVSSYAGLTNDEIEKRIDAALPPFSRQYLSRNDRKHPSGLSR